MRGRQKLTIMIIPETGKRTLSFRFNPVWLLPLAVGVVALILMVLVQNTANRHLEAQLVELAALRQTNRLQEAQIETLHNKAMENDQKLAELEGLESQVREILGHDLPSRGEGRQPAPEEKTGRGGPSGVQTLSNLPSLAGMLPPDVRALLFTKRDTLPMHMQEPLAAAQGHREKSAATAEEVAKRFERQSVVMERLVVELMEGKRTAEEHMEYLAHLPSGRPVSGGTFTDRFGWRWSPFGWGRQWHDGLDIAHDYWTPVVSPADGVVIHSGWKSGGYGYTVMIDHGYGFVTMYAHLSDTAPAVGTEVKRGSVIGWVGSTGDSTGPHLHYEVHVNGVPADPVKYLQ